MGRVKLQIKRIENTTSRQVTFSKRRNGLIKKAYELSVLCDVDVALIMFSPSGRLGHFSGNKSIEEILVRYVNLPEHERGRLQNQEFLQRALGKLKGQADQTYQKASPMSTDSQIEEIQQEIVGCKSQLEDMENRLRIFEGDPFEITTLCEAENREQILQETLRRVQIRKEHLPPNTTNISDLIRENPTYMLDWLPERDPQVQLLNFLDSNGLLPLRDQPQPVTEILQPPTTLHRQNMNLHDQMSLRSGMVDSNNLQRPDFGQVIDVNLSPWAEFYPAGNNGFSGSHSQPGGRDLLELYLSQFTPSTILTPNQHQR
ncbi:hypothetical protein RGQ29_009361 [Quercus rubra]|uniref:MADS-box domain-containing protein n=1 Tax=Quercus rubra TaxID=3512 RepID=A0AAN7IYW5_QUERU|nr:hypothetical protein RGQ29_009361 [Quercus rubra]